MDPMVAMVPSTAILPTPLLLERRPSHQFPMQSKLETINRKDPTLPQFKPNAIGHSARGLHRLGQKQHNMDLPAKLVGRTRNQHPDLTIDDVRKCRRCDQDHAKLHASIHRNDPTLPQFRPNAENHFMLCLMCNAYHHESCITPPPGDRMSLNTEINKVIDGLYISNICSAIAVVSGRESLTPKFTHVVSLHSGNGCDIPRLTPESDSSLVSKHIILSDSPHINLVEHFPEICHFLHTALMQRTASGHEDVNILVHCHAGKSRSASAVLAYLIWSRRYTFDQALDFLRTSRSLVNPNDGFRAQLRLWETLGGRLSDGYNLERPKYTVAKKNKWLRQSRTSKPNLCILNDLPRPVPSKQAESDSQQQLTG